MHARLLRRCSVVRDVYPNAQTCGNAQLPPLAGTSLPIARTLCANSERRADKFTNATRAPRTSSQQRACPTLCFPSLSNTFTLANKTPLSRTRLHDTTSGVKLVSAVVLLPCG